MEGRVVSIVNHTERVPAYLELRCDGDAANAPADYVPRVFSARVGPVAAIAAFGLDTCGTGTDVPFDSADAIMDTFSTQPLPIWSSHAYASRAAPEHIGVVRAARAYYVANIGEPRRVSRIEFDVLVRPDTPVGTGWSYVHNMLPPFGRPGPVSELSITETPRWESCKNELPKLAASASVDLAAEMPDLPNLPVLAAPVAASASAPEPDVASQRVDATAMECEAAPIVAPVAAPASAPAQCEAEVFPAPALVCTEITGGIAVSAPIAMAMELDHTPALTAPVAATAAAPAVPASVAATAPSAANAENDALRAEIVQLRRAHARAQYLADHPVLASALRASASADAPPAEFCGAIAAPDALVLAGRLRRAAAALDSGAAPDAADVAGVELALKAARAAPAAAPAEPVQAAMPMLTEPVAAAASADGPYGAARPLKRAAPAAAEEPASQGPMRFDPSRFLRAAYASAQTVKT
jgi:hypothetical protein